MDLVGRKPGTIKNLNVRVKTWWAMVAFMGIVFAFGKTGVIVLFAVASVVALREFATLTPPRRGDYLPSAFFLVIPVQYFLIWIEWYGLYSIFIPVHVFLALPSFAVCRGTPETSWNGRVSSSGAS